MLPGEFPPRSSVQYYFYKWRDDGTWQEVNRALLARTREAEGRAAAATAGVIDSQSVKTTEMSRCWWPLRLSAPTIRLSG